jgi:hypothetical protein
LVERLKKSDTEIFTGLYRKGDAYCALGHLCEIHREETNIGYWWNFHGPFFSYQIKNKKGDIYLNKDVLCWADVTKDDANKLIKFNDSMGKLRRDNKQEEIKENLISFIESEF